MVQLFEHTSPKTPVGLPASRWVAPLTYNGSKVIHT